MFIVALLAACSNAFQIFENNAVPVFGPWLTETKIVTVGGFQKSSQDAIVWYPLV